MFKVFFGSEGLFSMTLLVLGDKRCRFFARPMNLFGKDRGDATPSYYQSLSNKVMWWAFYETESKIVAGFVQLDSFKFMNFLYPFLQINTLYFEQKLV